MCVFCYICLDMKTLYLFNPENDMALASGSPYYMPPASAKKMSADLAVLPAWYAEAEDEVLLPDERSVEWIRNGCGWALSVVGVTRIEREYERISPWGWSPALIHRLMDLGVTGGKVFMEDRMEAMRRLSSRYTAVSLLPKLQGQFTLGEAVWLASIDEVCLFSMQYEKVLLKAPWSGSGKGIQPLVGLPDTNLGGWIRRVIATQGGVVGEPFYHKVKDFAMEFLASDKGIAFLGYSLFEADARGIYKENLLASNECIESLLSDYVPLSVLHGVREALLKELPFILEDNYEGCLGVDMMIVYAEDGYAIHPCVEVNLRMNMGVVSRVFFDRYMSAGVTGRYVIEYYPQLGEALKVHKAMCESYPLVVKNGRIHKGYLSLTPVFEDTNYQIYVIV